MISAPYSRPLGIAEIVRKHGDYWYMAGIDYANRIHDDRLRRAYFSTMAQNSSDHTDAMKMRFYTERIYSRPINEVRGHA